MKKDNYIQYLRAIAIIAVILIHILPNENYTVIVRQFINFCVATFLFLSGYLTNKNIIDDISKFYKKRISRVLIPYIIWSIIFLIRDKDYNINSILFKFITGQTCSIYYYIIVYLELILLTPILIKALKSKINKFIWLLTPISIMILYICIFIGNPIQFPYNVLSFTVWIMFYYYGLQVGNLNKELSDNVKMNIGIYFIFIILSIGEGIYWYKQGNISMAISQMKITSIFTSLYFIKVAIEIKDKIKLDSKYLKMIGDYSFGIYLTHVLFLDLFKTYVSNIIILFIVVLVVNCSVIYLGNKILGKYSKYLGFR